MFYLSKIDIFTKNIDFSKDIYQFSRKHVLGNKTININFFSDLLHIYVIFCLVLYYFIALSNLPAIISSLSLYPSRRWTPIG